MKNTCLYIILTLNIIILFGCEKDIDFNEKIPRPKIVVNSIVNAQSDTNRIKISESVFDYSGEQPGTVENPDIHLSINGKECDRIWLDTVIDVHTYYEICFDIERRR
jgi:hypothetical protein